MTMDVTPSWQNQAGALPNGSAPQPRAVGPASPRTGAFSTLRTRWLILWALVGALLVTGLSEAASELGFTVSDELAGVLLYLPIIAWVAVMVVGRAGVNLAAMLRWPKLGTYWFVVAGMLVVQFVFSLAAILVTGLVAPWMGDSLAGVGQGNVILATIGLVVLPPLVEEVVFRGVLLERFSVKWRVGVAVILSAVLFGILHADPVGAGMFGIITGLLYLRTGSLWPGIIIHAVNNLVALAATRMAGADVERPTPEVGETLITAGVLLAISVPFLVWFIARTWPRRGTLTPYQQYEAIEAGSSPARFSDIVWSGASFTVGLTVTPTHLIVDRPGEGPGAAQVLAVLPLEQVASAYLTDIPGGRQVVVLLSDGSWSTMRVGPGIEGPTGELAEAIMAHASHARQP